MLGRYQLGSRIGAGAAGSVFRAVDTRSGQAVVVKLFDGQEDGFPPWASEMRLVLRFRHSNIVSCLDTGFDESSRMWVLIFELAAGGSLRRALVAGRSFPARQTARLLLDVSSALAYAHEQGVVHRDVKPENIVARTESEDSAWLLTDFGAGRFLAAGQVARSLAGSAEYMAPEVLIEEATAASDQFSLGVVGMELLLGQRPSPRERSEIAESLRARPGLFGIIGRLAAGEPARRFAGMVEVVTTLQRELKEMKSGGDTVDLLRPYLRAQHAVSEDALQRLIEQWNQEGSFLDFLVGQNLLPRAAARTLEAVRKGYLNVPIESVLGLTATKAQDGSAFPAVVGPSPATESPSLQEVALVAVSTSPTTEFSFLRDGSAIPAVVSTSPATEPSSWGEASATSAAVSPSPATESASLQELPPVPVLASQSTVEATAGAVVSPPSATSLRTTERAAESPPAASRQSLPPPDSARTLPQNKPAAGLRVGRYILQEQLGEGATATVFRSFHETLNIPVAIKIFAPLDGFTDPEAPERFRREAQTLVRLEHPHIVRILDADIDGPFPYIVMEYVGEATLETQINNLGKLPAQRIIQIGLAVADALEAASKAGLLHRDVKPSNILERRDGHIKLVDFGIVAKRMPDGGLNDPQAALGFISGTPLYLAPEQALRPDSIDFRADMYGLGATLYHAAVGHPPLVRATAYDTMMAQIHDEPVPIRHIDPSFNAQLAATIHRMLRKKPEDRFGSWADARAALACAPIPDSSITPVMVSAPQSPPGSAELPGAAESRPQSAVLPPVLPAANQPARSGPAPQWEPLLGRWTALPQRSRQTILAGGALLMLFLIFVCLWLGVRT